MAAYQEFDLDEPVTSDRGRELPDGLAVVCVILLVLLPFAWGLLVLKALVIATNFQGTFANEFSYAAGGCVLLSAVIALALRRVRVRRSHRWLAGAGAASATACLSAYLLMRAVSAYNDPPPERIWPDTIEVVDTATETSSGMGSQEVARKDEDHFVRLRIAAGIDRADGCADIEAALDRSGGRTEYSRGDDPCRFGGSAGEEGGWAVAPRDDLTVVGVLDPWLYDPDDGDLVLVVY